MPRTATENWSTFCEDMVNSRVRVPVFFHSLASCLRRIRVVICSLQFECVFVCMYVLCAGKTKIICTDIYEFFCVTVTNDPQDKETDF